MHAKLSFEHLYDDRWGHIRKSAYSFISPTIIFPLGFMPENGKKYDCEVIETSATFIYNGVSYKVLSAYLENCAGITEEIEYAVRELPPEKTAMEKAFENAKG